MVLSIYLVVAAAVAAAAVVVVVDSQPLLLRSLTCLQYALITVHHADAKHFSMHFFCPAGLNYLSRAPWTGGLSAVLSLYGLDVHPALVVALLPVAEARGVAVTAVDLFGE